jgi:hypothetical protein
MGGDALAVVCLARVGMFDEPVPAAAAVAACADSMPLVVLLGNIIRRLGASPSSGIAVESVGIGLQLIGPLVHLQYLVVGRRTSSAPWPFKFALYRRTACPNRASTDTLVCCPLSPHARVKLGWHANTCLCTVPSIALGQSLRIGSATPRYPATLPVAQAVSAHGLVCAVRCGRSGVG